jgi:hypothetical protein
MPEEINGLPLHPLVVHGVVVLIPLLALIAVVFLFPRWRRGLRWPMVALAVVVLGATFVARESGENLEESDFVPSDGPVYEAVERHEELANQLWYIVIAFVIVVLIAAYVLRPLDEVGPFPGDRSDSDEDGGATTLDTANRAVVAVLIIAGAGAAVVQVVRTGEQGSKAVWNPTGDTDFGVTQIHGSR